MNDLPENSSTKPPVMASPIVIDLGKHKRKAVRALSKGRGRLLEKIEMQIRFLAQNGEIEPSAQPVVVVVTPKKKKRKFGYF